MSSRTSTSKNRVLAYEKGSIYAVPPSFPSQRPVTNVLQTYSCQSTNDRSGRVGRIGHPAAFKVEQPLKWLLSMTSDRLLLAGSCPIEAHATLATCGEMCYQLCSTLSPSEKRPQLSAIFLGAATQFVTGRSNVHVPAPLQRLAAGGKCRWVAGAQRGYCRQ